MMRNKEIKPPLKEDERKFCPYDGEACPMRGRCFGEVSGAEYDYSTEVLSLKISLCPRAHCQDFERVLGGSMALLLTRIGTLDNVRKYMWELRRRDIK